MFPPSARLTSFVIALLAMSLALAACGGADSSSSSQDNADANAEQEQPAQASGLTKCVDDWNMSSNASLWMGQGFFNGSDQVEVAVGENGNCMLAACSGGAICLVMVSPCPDSQYDTLNVTYCPRGSATPASLEQFNPSPVSLSSDGTIS
jgi:hypothetical protein